MKAYTEDAIKSLIDQFETRQLPKSDWTHEAHLIVAVWYCKRYDTTKALNLLRVNISKYNESVGIANTTSSGYHETITIFWLKVASLFINHNQNLSVADLCNLFINSEFADREYPLKYYSMERLLSSRARLDWIEPDLESEMQ